MSKASYVAASALPWKLIVQKDRAIVGGQIVPLHLQLFPTNRCNSNCSWCSCKNRDKAAELPIDEIIQILYHFKQLGTQALSLSGGGEPTLHPDFDTIIRVAHDLLGMEVGLVTNGLLWTKHEIRQEIAQLLSWARLSINDTESGDYDSDRVRRFGIAMGTTPFGISFTCGANVDLDTVRNISMRAQATSNCTHIRFVDDIVNPDPTVMARVKAAAEDFTDKGIFQSRGGSEPGVNPCLVSGLRPVVDATGTVFPCCGVQYAGGGENQTLDMDSEYSMGNWRYFPRQLTSPYFDGSACQKCFYGDHNRTLATLLNADAIEHVEFV